jgi:hypothetical protein
MKVISDRISILKTPELLSIVILPAADKKKLTIMLLWLMAWTTCGVIVFANYFKVTDQNSKLFIIIYLSFWAYYEYKIGRAFIWRKFGKEKIWIKEGFLNYQREVNGKGKINQFELQLINDLKPVDIKAGSFSDLIEQSFWVKGGEKLELSYQAKVVRFGMQLNEKEAALVLKDLSQAIFHNLDKR